MHFIIPDETEAGRFLCAGELAHHGLKRSWVGTDSPLLATEIWTTTTLGSYLLKKGASNGVQDKAALQHQKLILS